MATSLIEHSDWFVDTDHETSTIAETGKDVVKALENGSSVAVHAESHVPWILLVGGNNFFSNGRAISASLSGERANPSGELPRRNVAHSRRLFLDRSCNKKSLSFFSTLPVFYFAL